MKTLSRRQFAAIGAMTPLFATEPQKANAAQRAYLSFDSGIQVFSLSDESCVRIQTVPSRRPVSLALDRQQRRLFAVNSVDEHEGLPRGTVESYDIDGATGRLSLADRTPLSLSATRPLHLALAPGGDYLVVAAYGGGLYNVLPVDATKGLSGPSHIFKETGCGRHPDMQASAHPYSLVFDKAGRLIASDMGADRLSVFNLEGGKLVRCSSISAQPGDGPGPLAIDPSGKSLLVENLLDASVSVYPYYGSSGQIGREIQRRPLPSDGSPAGRFVCNTSNLSLRFPELAKTIDPLGQALCFVFKTS